MIPMLTLLLLFGGSLENNADFIDGLGSYRAMDIDQALFSFQKAALAPDTEPKDRAVVFAWMGLCYGTIGDQSGMERAFAEALSLDVDVKLPEFAPPKIVAALARAAWR